MKYGMDWNLKVSGKGKLTVITQPGMRYAQAEAITSNILLDSEFQELSIKERKVNK